MSTAIERIIVVVGAAGGIGKQIVLQLQPHARIVAVVQDEAQRLEVAPLAVQAIACDLADADSVQRTIDTIRESNLGGIHGLIFTAAMQPVGPLEITSRRELERLFAINVFGTLQFVQGLIPALRRNQGRIVLFSSMAGRVAAPMLGAYSGTKFALEGMCDSLRRELRLSGISLSLIEPGGVSTPMATAQGPLVERLLRSLDAETEQRYGPLMRGYRAMTEKGLRHASTPTDVARIAVDAAIGRASPKARYAVGLDAKLTMLLARWLPTSWLDALLMKVVLGK